MQTAIRTNQEGFGRTHYPLGRPVRNPERDIGTKKKDTAAGGKRHDFLTDKIPPLAPDFWHKDAYDGTPANLTTPENFDYLYQSALNYAGLMGVKLPFRYRKGGSPRLKITELYKVMDENVPECVNLEKKDGRLHFCLYRYHDWPEPALFWIPIDFTERLPAAFRRIVKEFIRKFMWFHGIGIVTDAFCFDAAVEELTDWEIRDPDASPKEVWENRRLAESYQSGKRKKALRRMSGKPFCSDLEKRISSYRTEEENERQLLDLIREGLAWIAPENPSLTNYLYDWAYEENPDFLPVGMEQQVMVVYSGHDTLARSVKDYMNSDYRESYAITPVTYLYLTPETDTLFRMDDYPERLSQWLERFTGHINDNFKIE